jgi:hypothetical protein
MTRKLIFVKGRRLGRLGSAYLRCDQLRAILARSGLFAPDDLGITDQPEAARGSLLVVNKSYLMEHGLGALGPLRRAGNVVAIDADLLIASSRMQEAFFREHFPGIATVYVPHHADLRIPPVGERPARFALGYFGALYNAPFMAELVAENLCDFHKADDPADTGWMRRLPDYACHYAARSWQGFDGFKPFTKGIIAARCGAVVLVDRNPEAVAALGADYPFYIDDPSLSGIRSAVAQARATFGSGLWDSAQSAMATLAASVSEAAVAASMLDLRRHRP